MKKLVFLFVAFAAVSFASCGNKAANNNTEVAADSAAVVAETAACDSACTDACCDSTAVVAE